MNQGLLNDEGEGLGVRIITAAPEVEGVMESVGELTKRGIVFSIGHRFVETTFSFNCSSKWSEPHYPSF